MYFTPDETFSSQKRRSTCIVVFQERGEELINLDENSL